MHTTCTHVNSLFCSVEYLVFVHEESSNSRSLESYNKDYQLSYLLKILCKYLYHVFYYKFTNDNPMDLKTCFYNYFLLQISSRLSKLVIEYQT